MNRMHALYAQSSYSLSPCAFSTRFKIIVIKITRYTLFAHINFLFHFTIYLKKKDRVSSIHLTKPSQKQCSMLIYFPFLHPSFVRSLVRRLCFISSLSLVLIYFAIEFMRDREKESLMKHLALLISPFDT